MYAHHLTLRSIASCVSKGGNAHLVYGHPSRRRFAPPQGEVNLR